MREGFAKAIVVGAHGFIGKVLIEALLRDQIDVLRVDRQGFSGFATPFVQADITQREGLNQVAEYVGKEGPRIALFHLAGVAHQGLNQRDPLEASMVHIMGTLHVLELCRQNQIGKLIYPSTALVYGKTLHQASCEGDETDPSSIYTATKLAVEKLIQGYSREYGLSCAVARLGNVYGQGAAEDTICSIVLQQAINHLPFAVKTLSPIRDFIYVKDVVQGLLRIAERIPPRSFNLYNLATGKGTSVGELIRLLSELTKREYDVETNEPSCEASRLILSMKKVEQECNWHPQWSLRDGLNDTLHELEKNQKSDKGLDKQI